MGHGGTIADGEHAKIGTRVAAMVLGAVGNVQEHVAGTSQGTTLTAPVAADAIRCLRLSFEVGLYFCSVKLAVQRDGLYLYRNIIPPAVSDLAFVGSEVSTFNNILTHGLQAVWLRQVLTGEMRLPQASAMHQIVEKEQAWKRSWMPASSARASIWQLHMMKYHDNLCKDMQMP